MPAASKGERGRERKTQIREKNFDSNSFIQWTVPRLGGTTFVWFAIVIGDAAPIVLTIASPQLPILSSTGQWGSYLQNRSKMVLLVLLASRGPSPSR